MEPVRNLPLPLIGLCLSLLFAGCKSKNLLPSYSKNVVGGWPKGRQLDPYDVSRVREPEHIHAYHLGRLPSKDRRSMSEAHTVYRKEHDAAWDTRLPATPMESHGAVFGIREPSHRPVPESDIVKTEMIRQRELSGKIRKSQEKIVMLEKNLQTKIAQFESSSAIFDDVQNQLKQTREEKAELEKQLKETESTLKKTKEELDEAKMEADMRRPAGNDPDDLLKGFGSLKFESETANTSKMNRG